jgi:hypothetical protein
MPILTAVDQLSKGMQAVSHKLTLVRSRLQHLEQANKALSKRRKTKRTRLQDTGVVTGSEARNIMAENGVIEEERRDEGENEGSSKRRRTSARLCSVCHQPGHNARTCPDDREMDSSDNSK